MSEKKRVIRVNDLVIEAENVIIEPQRPHHDKENQDERVDPFFGRRVREEAEESSSREHSEEESSDRRGFWF